MYLEKILIKNFRSIRKLELTFKKGINILIGENNSGKSAIIDALRICFNIGRQWRDIGVKNDEDFYIDISEIKDNIEPIEFDLTFKIEAPEDAFFFNSMVYQDPDNPEFQNVQMHFRYLLEKNKTGNKTLRWKIWGGNIEGQQIKSEEAQLIYFTYLAPLRDAEHELRPYVRENKITSLFQELTKFYTFDEENKPIEKALTEEFKNELALKLDNVINEKDWTGVIKTGEQFINEHLANADIKNKESRINLRLLEYKFNNIVKGILTRKPVYSDDLLKGDMTKQKYFDVSQNGLGDNNLIYSSAVLGDLKNRREEGKEHYYALLIEEPEAHLHPQKQNTFFNYLNSLKDFGVQLFITSHSPTLTAKSDLDNLVILHKKDNNITSYSITYSGLRDEHINYLKKFLDVTKSQLFFSNGVILVEGISEALLLPIFSNIVNKDYDLDKNGIEIVNINGVAFEPFAMLFNSKDPLKRLSSKCSVLTDGDQHRYSNKLSARAYKLLEFEVADSNLKIFIAQNTFEFELMTLSEENADIIKSIYEELHPKTNLLGGADLETRAFELLEKLDSNKDKSELAQRLSYVLENKADLRNQFQIPLYITNSVKWAINE
ncbi:MAG TPA: AAA family ATPase [Ignavibacteria bacterium]